VTTAPQPLPNLKHLKVAIFAADIRGPFADAMREAAKKAK